MRESDSLDFQRYCRSGDRAALARVFDRTAPRLLLVAVRRTGDVHQAEDLVQTTFLQAMQSAGTYDPRRPLLPWLVRILCNREVDRRRAERRDPERSPEDPDSLPSVAEFDVEELELLETVQAAIESLPAPYRAVVAQRCLEGKQPRDIARDLDRSADTVRSQLRRGLAMLRSQLPAGVGVGVAVLTGAACLAGVRRRVLLDGATTLPARVAFLSRRLAMVGALALLGLLASMAFGGTTAHAPLSKTQVARVPTPPPVVSAARVVAASAVGAQASEPEAASPRWQVVYAEDGRPAAGVALTLHGFWALRGVEAPRILTTDERGEIDPRGIPDGRFWLGRDQGVQVLADPRRSVSLRIPRGREVAGQVRDRSGAPIPNASVWLSYGHALELGRVVTQSDAFGEFRLRAVADYQYVAVAASGFAASARYAVGSSVDTIEQLDVVLERPERRLTGVVRGPRGLPVAGAKVRLAIRWDHAHRNADGPNSREPRPRYVVTGADGRFAFAHLRSEHWDLRVRAGAFATHHSGVRIGPEDVTRDVVLQDGVVVRGRVTDAEGAPVAGAMVTAGPPAPLLCTVSYTDTSGRYRMVGVAPGRILLTASADRRGRYRGEVVGEAGGDLPLDLCLQPGVAMTGQLVDAEDQPLADWLVTAEWAQGRGGSGRTDAAGRFVLSALHGQPPYRVTARRGVDDPPTVLRVGAKPGELGALRLREGMLPTGVIRGRLLLPEGVPPRDAAVVLRSSSAGWEELRPVSASTGAFELVGCPVGELQVGVAMGCLPEHRLAVVRISPHETTDVGALPVPEPGVLRLVLTESVDDAEGLQLTLRTKDGAEVARLRRDGDVAVSPHAIWPGDYIVHVTGRNVIPQRMPMRVAPGATSGREVAVATGARCSVQIDWAELTDRSGWVGLRVTDRSGGMVLQQVLRAQLPMPAVALGLRPGRYVFEAKSTQGLTVRSDVTVLSDGAVVRLVFGT